MFSTPPIQWLADFPVKQFQIYPAKSPFLERDRMLQFQAITWWASEPDRYLADFVVLGRKQLMSSASRLSRAAFNLHANCLAY
jgi:hypothetical protein